MVTNEVSKAIALCRGVSNPIPAMLDRMGWQKKPYTLNLRNGLLMELRPSTGDLFGFYEIMLRKDYLAHGQKLSPGATVIDIGANIGCFTLLASKLVGESGRVFAIEPEATTYRQLVSNIQLNRARNVTALKIAVGGTKGTITLHADTNRLFSSIYSSVNGHEVQGDDQQVDMTTLEALMTSNRIEHCDYLKLDCEGAEHDIVRSMPPATARRIAQITMEVHKVPGANGESLRMALEQLGFSRIGASTLPFYVQTGGAS